MRARWQQGLQLKDQTFSFDLGSPLLQDLVNIITLIISIMLIFVTITVDIMSKHHFNDQEAQGAGGLGAT